MRPVVYSLTFLSLLSLSVSAQQNLGIATSNWAGMESLYQNPANIADSRTKFCIEVFSLNTGVDNNLGYINSNGGLLSAINSGNTNNMFSYNNSNSFSLLAPYAQVHLPGFMISLDHKNSIALTLGINGINQFNNFNQSLYHTITDPNFTTNSDISLTSSKFNYTAHLWSQVGLTYGGVLVDQGHSEVKIGATIRYLGGIGYVGLKGNNLDVNYKAGNDSVYVSNSDLEYASNILSTKNALLNGFTNNSILSEFFGSKSGMGAGGDVGIVYDYIPEFNGEGYFREGRGANRDYSKNRYKFRLAASVMDIGAITYKASSNSNAEFTGNGYVTGAGLAANVNNFTSFKNYMLKQGFTADTASFATKVYMPTTFHISADYNIWKRIYVNATYVANLANRQDFGNSYYDFVAVTPRYDSKVFSVGLPISYSMLTDNIKMGIGVRVYGFYIGSDDMLALFASHQYGFNFNIGGFVPFNYKKNKTDAPADSTESPEPDMEPGNQVDTTDNCPDRFYRAIPSKPSPMPAGRNEDADTRQLMIDDADKK